jgi:hypothetical protein
MIRRSVKVLREFSGRRPVGWMGPGLTETLDTPELLAAAGIKYIADWVIDDEPCTIRTRGGISSPCLILELNERHDGGEHHRRRNSARARGHVRVPVP